MMYSSSNSLLWNQDHQHHRQRKIPKQPRIVSMSSRKRIRNYVLWQKRSGRRIPRSLSTNKFLPHRGKIVTRLRSFHLRQGYGGQVGASDGQAREPHSSFIITPPCHLTFSIVPGFCRDIIQKNILILLPFSDPTHYFPIAAALHGWIILLVSRCNQTTDFIDPPRRKHLSCTGIDTIVELSAR